MHLRLQSQAWVPELKLVQTLHFYLTLTYSILHQIDLVLSLDIGSLLVLALLLSGCSSETSEPQAFASVLKLLVQLSLCLSLPGPSGTVTSSPVQ